MHYALVRNSSYQIWWPKGICKQLSPGWPYDPCMTFDPSSALRSGQRLFSIKFGSHRAFVSNLIPGWPRWGRFENMPTNLVGPSPTPMPTFSSIPQSMTKRIAGHTYIHTFTHTYIPTYIQDSIILVVLMTLRISKQLPSGWRLITPGSYMTFLSKFTSCWSQLTLARSLTPSMHYTLVWSPFYKYLVATERF